MAQKFFFVCGGLFLLVLAYHLGAGHAQAQGPGNPVADLFVGRADQNYFSIITENGDVWMWDPISSTGRYYGNMFGAPVPVQQESWGAIKGRYRR